MQLRWKILTAAVFLLSHVVQIKAVQSQTIYTDSNNRLVRGSWSSAGDNILVVPQQVGIDLNADGIDDAVFTHDFRLRSNRLGHDSYELLNSALAGLHESHDLLLDIRATTIPATSRGLLDADELGRSVARIDSAMERLQLVADGTKYNDQALLDGSAGIYGIPSTTEFRWIGALPSTLQGNSRVQVLTAAERAHATPWVAQERPLGQHELLNINGVQVQLLAGMTTTQVRDRINEYSTETGVYAELHERGPNQGRIRLATHHFGAAASLQIVSNIEAASNSSGFGDTEISDIGQDAVVEMAGFTQSGKGTVVIADRDFARGIAIQLIESPNDSTRTYEGHLGWIQVIDNSLQLPLLPDARERLTVSLPNVGPAALGLGVVGNFFSHLQGIDISNDALAREALEVIDESVVEVRNHMADIRNVLDHHYAPYGALTIEGHSTAEILSDESGAVVRLTAGDVIDETGEYTSDAQLVNELTFGGTTTGYFGVRIKLNETAHYGWIRGSLGRDDELTIHDYSFQSMPETGIRAGFVPEPRRANSVWLLMLGLWARFARRRMAN